MKISRRFLSGLVPVLLGFAILSSAASAEEAKKILQLDGLTGEQKQNAYLSMANDTASREGPSRAAAILKQALDAAPESPKAPFIKLSIQRLESMTRAEAAAVRLKAEVEKASGPQRLKLLDQLLDAYAKLGNRIAGADQSADVKKWCTEVIELDPENRSGLKRKYEFRVRLDDAQKAFLGREFAEAETAVDKVLEMKGLNADEFQRAALLKSSCCIAKKDYQASLVCLRKALDAGPDGPNAAVLKFLIQRSEKFLESQKAAAGVSKQGSSASSNEKSDPLKVPDGTPEQLFAYIEGLKRGPAEPPKDSLTRMELTRAINAATICAADKILAAKPTAEQTAKALQLQLTALSSQPAYFIDAKAMAKLEQLIGQLDKAKLPKEAREAKRVFLTCKVRSVSFSGRPEELEKVVDQIKEYCGSGPADSSWAYLATTTGRAVEQTGKTAFAAKTYRDLSKIFAAQGDKGLADTALTLEGAARRVELVEHPMLVEAVTLDGKPLDWSKYAGKVVLVDFWATWCGPCRAELPNVKRAYAAYHDRGFEVIGISLDQSREALDKFMETEKLPWTIVLDDPWNKGKGSAANEGEKEADAKPASPVARYYGVFSTPTAILLGKDGKAVSLNARGEVLTQELERLLGPADGKKE